MLEKIILKKNEDSRIRQGHLWIFSNEVNNDLTPIKSFSAGQQVIVESSKGKAIGLAYVNPNNLIFGRILSRDIKQNLNIKFIKYRIQAAQTLRDLCFSKPYYRLIFAESDGLPGLVIDRFGDVFSVQISTAGMDVFKEDILKIISNLYNPKAIVLKNNLSSRKLEGLSTYEEVAAGEVPNELVIIENQTKFIIPIINGQKTGWFYDHRTSRQQLQSLVKDKTVLDVFSYIGSWGLEMIMAGAKEVTCVDSSETALDNVHINAKLNNISDKVTTIQGNAFEVLKALRADLHKYDVVIVDPPAFIKRKKDLKSGKEAYRRINELALQVLNIGGVLVSSSCSHHLTREGLLQQVQLSSRHVDRNLQLFNQGFQSSDHPIHPAIPETQYLKSLFFKSNKNG